MPLAAMFGAAAPQLTLMRNQNPCPTPLSLNDAYALPLASAWLHSGGEVGAAGVSAETSRIRANLICPCHNVIV